MKILNLGCGTKVSSRPEVVNIDWSMYLRLKKNSVLRLIVPLLLRGERLDHFNAIPDNILVHNLGRSIPFEADSIDVVYQPHFL